MWSEQCLVHDMARDMAGQCDHSVDQSVFTKTEPAFSLGFCFQLGPTSGQQAIAGFPDIRWHQTADVGYLPNEKMPNTFLSVAYDLADSVGR